MTDAELTRRITEFLQEIGIRLSFEDLGEDCFLPGIRICPGTAVSVDLARLKWPGDLLHEAGHLAVKLPEERSLVDSNPGTDGGEEMAAMAWSYAAAMHLNIPPGRVFHEGGYKGGGANLIDALEREAIGVPLLRYYGMLEGEWPFLEQWLRPGQLATSAS